MLKITETHSLKWTLAALAYLTFPTKNSHYVSVTQLPPVILNTDSFAWKGEYKMYRI